jgi:hypothetical protein
MRVKKEIQPHFAQILKGRMVNFSENNKKHCFKQFFLKNKKLTA